jgi:hypothetical protein
MATVTEQTQIRRTADELVRCLEEAQHWIENDDGLVRDIDLAIEDYKFEAAK